MKYLVTYTRDHGHNLSTERINQHLAKATHAALTKILPVEEVELTRFCGRPNVSFGGVRDGRQKCQVYAGV
jgi:hypothetical protein